MQMQGFQVSQRRPGVSWGHDPRVASAKQP